MNELRDILFFRGFKIDIDNALMNIIMATIFVWLVYTIQNVPIFG